MVKEWDDLRVGDTIRVAWQEWAHNGTFVRLDLNSNPEFYGAAPVVVYTVKGYRDERTFVPAPPERPRPGR